jgi:cell division protein FtsB
MTIIVVTAAIVTIATGVSAWGGWIYRQVQKLADTQAKIKALEERIAGLEAELNLIRTRRRHILSLI